MIAGTDMAENRNSVGSIAIAAAAAINPAVLRMKITAIVIAWIDSDTVLFIVVFLCCYVALYVVNYSSLFHAVKIIYKISEFKSYRQSRHI